MTPTVIFRDFEERDIDFIYRCKNDEKLNSMIVGQWHPFTYEEATNWVHGCMGEHETYKFWAIATNDEEKRIVGWVSLSNIDRVNKSACMHGLVIGDKTYRDGFVWIEAYLFVMKYVFEVMRFHRLWGEHIENHPQSSVIGTILGWSREGLKRDALFHNGVFHNLSFGSILDEDYYHYKEEGMYEIRRIIKNICHKNSSNNKND